jgi:hypothetical protein
MARMGHDSERAAMIYQHEARGADIIQTAIYGSSQDAAKGSWNP